MTTNAPGGFDLAAALASLPANNSQQGNTVPGQKGINGADQGYYNVYFGSSPVKKQFDPNAGSRVFDNEMESYTGSKDKSMDINSAASMLWDPVQGKQIMQRLYKLGLIDSPTDITNAEGAWNNALLMAGKFYTIGGNKVTPWQVLDMFAGTANAAKAKQNQPYTHTGTSTEAHKYTAEDLKGYATKAFQDYLGRDPSAKEQSAVAAAMQRYAAANPTVTHETVHGDGKGNETKNSTVTGGVSDVGAAQVIRDQAQADPEYGAYQAATTYMGALEALIGGGR